MGTRSIIAEPHGDGFRGRYCHWDGHPSWNGVQLAKLVQRDGVERVREVLLHDHGYWSTIDAAATEADLADHERNGSFQVVPGFGKTSDMRAEECPDWVTDQDVTSHGAEWGYVIGDREMLVMELPWDGGNPRLVAYDDPEAIDTLKGWG